jgi:hypothetical protein
MRKTTQSTRLRHPRIGICDSRLAQNSKDNRASALIYWRSELNPTGGQVMKKVLFLVLCGIASGAFADEIYKCEQDGRRTISTTPCPPGATATVVPVEKLPPASESPEQELERMKQQADAMERDRLARETPTPAAADETKHETDETAGAGEAAEPANAHGRLNVAYKKREQQQQ